jgi:hypothetical protein
VKARPKPIERPRRKPLLQLAFIFGESDVIGDAK